MQNARELTKAVEPFIKQEDEGKFRCKTCLKLFKATSFVEKHIANKHPELVKHLDEVNLAFVNPSMLPDAHCTDSFRTSIILRLIHIEFNPLPTHHHLSAIVKCLLRKRMVFKDQRIVNRQAITAVRTSLIMAPLILQAILHRTLAVARTGIHTDTLIRPQFTLHLSRRLEEMRQRQRDG
jgi:hypothetical protein